MLKIAIVALQESTDLRDGQRDSLIPFTGWDFPLANRVIKGIDEFRSPFWPVEDILDSLSQCSFADHKLDAFCPAHGGLVIRVHLWLSPVGGSKHFREVWSEEERWLRPFNISSTGQKGERRSSMMVIAAAGCDTQMPALLYLRAEGENLIHSCLERCCKVF